MSIKIRLIELGKKQTDLVVELRKRRYKIQPGELSQMLTGQLTTPKSKIIKHEVENIISDWEKQAQLPNSAIISREDLFDDKEVI